MSFLYTINIVLLLLVFLAINVALWRQLKKWFKVSERPSTFALFAARLSIMLTASAYAAAVLVAMEHAAVFQGHDAAPIHGMASGRQRAGLTLLVFVIALATPFIVAAAFGFGLVGFVRGGRINDERARKAGLIGMLLNGALIALTGFLVCGGAFSSGSPAEENDRVESAASNQ